MYTLIPRQTFKKLSYFDALACFGGILASLHHLLTISEANIPNVMYNSPSHCICTTHILASSYSKTSGSWHKLHSNKPVVSSVPPPLPPNQTNNHNNFDDVVSLQQLKHSGGKILLLCESRVAEKQKVSQMRKILPLG